MISRKLGIGLDVPKSVDIPARPAANGRRESRYRRQMLRQVGGKVYRYTYSPTAPWNRTSSAGMQLFVCPSVKERLRELDQMEKS